MTEKLGVWGAEWQGFAFGLPSRLAFGEPPTPLQKQGLGGAAPEHWYTPSVFLAAAIPYLCLPTGSIQS